MKATHVVSFILVAIGGLNWGLVGLGGWNLVDMIFGAGSIVARIVYILVGLATLVLIFTHKKDCKCCVDKGMASSAPTM
jgi:uncharacterized membrane protein YuzA (DUF378 family)